ncbi:DUF4382 domain-containing protein [Marinoscillum pacificum]|uniref:DUF4382 domain-containing protein n=1 Tax=Marinoscillum pacificum TaxID=392723 RepID=UPI0021583A16|nr:DUF4382 domain-containing protein [Marinoscillum pacificum]
MKTRNILSTLLALITLSALIYSCDSESEVSGKGTAGVKVTDAAVDAENISGVYLSVAEVQAIGKSETKTLTVFDEPRIFNLMDYQNGSTYELGEGEIDAGLYSEIRLITDGNSYVSFDDGSTEPLNIPSGTSSGYKIKGDYQISANNRTDLVIDVDLRKAFVLTGEGTYKLRPTARLINEEGTATITGTLSSTAEDRVIVYAYAKGTYDSSEEAEPASGESRFENSVNSAVVSNGSFTLAFMEPGEYDLIAVAYESDETNNTYNFRAATEAEVLLNGHILSILELEANTNVNLLLNVSFE